VIRPTARPGFQRYRFAAPISKAMPMGKNRRIAGAGLVLIAAIECWQAHGLRFGSFSDPGPAYWPTVLATALAAVGAATLVFGDDAAEPTDGEWAGLRKALAVVVCIGFVFLAVHPLGYRATVAIVTIFLLGAVEGRHPAITLGAASLLAFGTESFFERTLHASLPKGFWDF
jgi:hypothetical protein